MTAYVHKLVPYMWQPFACSVASVVFNSLQHYGLQPARLLSPWDCPGKSTGMGCHALLQAIFPTQGWNRVSCTMGGFFTTELPGKSFKVE